MPHVSKKKKKKSPGLRVFVRAIGSFSACLAGISLVRLSRLFVPSCLILFVCSFTAFVRCFVAFHLVQWLMRSSIVFSL